MFARFNTKQIAVINLVDEPATVAADASSGLQFVHPCKSGSFYDGNVHVKMEGFVE